MGQVLKLQGNGAKGAKGDHWFGLVMCGQYIYEAITSNLAAWVWVFELCGEFKGVFFQNIPSHPQERKFNSVLKD